MDALGTGRRNSHTRALREEEINTQHLQPNKEAPLPSLNSNFIGGRRQETFDHPPLLS
jgi:hypothetical protein